MTGIGWVILSAVLLLAAITVPPFISSEVHPKVKSWLRKAGLFFGVVSGAGFVANGFNYAEPGYVYHVRTIAGTERVINRTGWYFSGWRDPVEWKKHYTVAFISNPKEVDDEVAGSGSSLNGPYTVTMADNVRGNLTATVRFKIPEDEKQFLNIAYTYRSPQRLVDTSLRQSVQASLDAVASLMGAEEYFTSGRNQFKQEFREIMQKGIPHTERKEQVVEEATTDPGVDAGVESRGDLGDNKKIKFKVEKLKDSTGSVLRNEHKFTGMGITITEAILTQFDADQTFLKRIDARRSAAAARAVAREKRLEEEQKRLLAIAKGQREVAEKQAEAKKEQITQTTNAETQRQLSVINATRLKEQAQIDKQTSEIRLAQAKIDAQKIKELANAAAYEKKSLIEADGALQAKLDAWVEAQKFWSEAYAQRKVPTTVFANGSKDGVAGTDTSAKNFMDILTMNAAKDLQLDMKIQK